MNVLNSARFKAYRIRPLRQIRMRVLALCVMCVLVINITACVHDNSKGNHTGISPQTVEVIATLIGVTAETGLLILTKNHFAATAISGVAGVGAKYVIDEIGLTCKACGTASAVKGSTVTEAEPGLMSCSNASCKRYAYLVVSSFQDKIAEVLRQAKESIPPTCLLTKEDSGGGDIKLTWYSHNATSASLNGQLVSPTGSMTVHPAQTTTYLLKVIGKYGKSEDSVTAEIEQEEPDNEDSDSVDEPAPVAPAIPYTPPPSNPRHTVKIYLHRIVVHEDGSLGATDWSFGMFLNERNLITIPKQSYHDDDQGTVGVNMSSEAIVEGKEITLRIRGYNFDDKRLAEGAVTVSLDSFTKSFQRGIEVTVPENYKKGNFIFYITIEKQN